MEIPEVLQGKLATDVATAAHMLGIGRSRAYGHVRDGDIPSVKIGGRFVVPVSPLLDMLGISREKGVLPDRPVISVQEAAALIGIGRRQAYEAANDGTLPVLRIGKSIRVKTGPLAEMFGATLDSELRVRSSQLPCAALRADTIPSPKPAHAGADQSAD